MVFDDIYKEGYLPFDIEWKDIEGLEGSYQISNYGHVKRLSRIKFDKNNRKTNVVEKIFLPKPIQNDKTYYTRVNFGLHRDFTHRIVAKTFLENPNNLPEVNHKNGNLKFYNFAGTKENNYTDGNLEWCTRKENMLYASKNDLLNRDSEKRKEAIRKNQKLSIEKNERPVLMFDINNILIAEFKSILIAGIITGIPQQNIGRACRRSDYTAGGFIWQYK